MSTRSRPGARLASALLAACCLLLATPARSGTTERQVDFDIPAQDLSRALDRYGEASGMAVLVDRELTRGRRSAPLAGRFGVRQGLQRLLAGSGLLALHAGQDAFTLEAANDPGARAADSRQTRRGSFASALQASLGQALCSHPATRGHGYRVALQVWIDADGAVRRSRLLASSGDPGRDAALRQVLGDLRLDRPPPSSLAQPVTVLVRPEAADGMECDIWKEANGA